MDVAARCLDDHGVGTSAERDEGGLRLVFAARATAGIDTAGPRSGALPDGILRRKDAHPGYITWEQFELNQQLLAANAAAHSRESDRGPAREGLALLQGLAVCGRCGRRMTVGYHQRHGVEVPDYRCMGQAIQTGSAPCHTVPGATIDPAIAQLLLDTVTPVALEVALTVQTELEPRADEADALRHSYVERARHRAELARRRYLAVDPDNRLVADSLEADWNDALRQFKAAEEDYQRASAAARATLTNEHKARVRALAADFPKLWSDPPRPENANGSLACSSRTSPSPRPTRSISTSTSAAARPPAVVPIPLASYQARQTDPDTLATLDRLLDTHTDVQAADALNRDGHRSGTGQAFSAHIVLHLRRGNSLPSHLDRLRSRFFPPQDRRWHLTMAHPGLKVGDPPSTPKSPASRPYPAHRTCASSR
jgi:Recombinase zinc beta ribbon domain